jgi:hypothetical protein
MAERRSWLRIDNTALSPAEVAARIIARFALPVADEHAPVE